MKITEILNEAYSDPNIRVELQKKGYKFLGKGVDQTAYLAPDGMILKIFGTGKSSKRGSGELSRAQKTFKAYADYCKAHPDNPFLPNFTDWTTFDYNGYTYLQIKMERLFPFPKKQWAEVLAAIADSAARSNAPETKKYFIDAILSGRNLSKSEQKSVNELLTHLGEEGFELLWDTIYDLKRVAKSIGLSNLDLHSGNFMLGEDGQIVISDPFFAGWGSDGSGWSIE